MKLALCLIKAASGTGPGVDFKAVEKRNIVLPCLESNPDTTVVKDCTGLV
jgi:hypothetical protein